MGIGVVEVEGGEIEVRCDGPEVRLCAAMGVVNAATAEVVAAIAQALADPAGWQGDGIVSPEHVALRGGVSPARARRLVATARALAQLPNRLHHLGRLGIEGDPTTAEGCASATTGAGHPGPEPHAPGRPTGRGGRRPGPAPAPLGAAAGRGPRRHLDQLELTCGGAGADLARARVRPPPVGKPNRPGRGPDAAVQARLPPSRGIHRRAGGDP